MNDEALHILRELLDWGQADGAHESWRCTYPGARKVPCKNDPCEVQLLWRRARDLVESAELEKRDEQAAGERKAP